MSKEILTNDEVEIVDEKAQEVKVDLRKFNRTELVVAETVKNLSAIIKPTNKDEANTVIATLKDASTVVAAIEKKRKELGQPFRDAVEKINNKAKELTDKIPGLIQKGKDLILAYEKDEREKAINVRTQARIDHITKLGFVAVGNDYENDGYTIHGRFVSNLDDVDWSDELSMYDRHLQKKALAKIEALKKEEESAEFFGDLDQKDAIAKKIEEVKSIPATSAAPVYVPAFGPSKTKGITKTWTHELIDISQVPAEYLMLDTAKVTQSIRSGVRSIPGIKIYQKESVSLR